jgi:hypothetical protein
MSDQKMLLFIARITILHDIFLKEAKKMVGDNGY